MKHDFPQILHKKTSLVFTENNYAVPIAKYESSTYLIIPFNQLTICLFAHMRQRAAFTKLLKFIRSHAPTVWINNDRQWDREQADKNKNFAHNFFLFPIQVVGCLLITFPFCFFLLFACRIILRYSMVIQLEIQLFWNFAVAVEMVCPRRHQVDLKFWLSLSHRRLVRSGRRRWSRNPWTDFNWRWVEARFFFAWTPGVALLLLD